MLEACVQKHVFIHVLSRKSYFNQCSPSLLFVFFTSHFDFCHGLLIGLLAFSFAALQFILQNTTDIIYLKPGFKKKQQPSLLLKNLSNPPHCLQDDVLNP